MNRYPIVIIFFVVLFFKSGYSQTRLRPPGIYEVGDTTIEVYNWKDPYAIREFKIINGTETILYRSFNRLTKKLQEEGAFKGGYSSGIWKFYGWTGRLKKEINYDNMVKTCYEKKVELNPEELFDFAKFREDSIFVEKIRRQKILAAKKNVIHDTVYIEKSSTLPKGKTVIATQATTAKPTEPVSASPAPVPAAPAKKEIPAAGVAQPAAVKPAEPVKAARTPAQPASVKKETSSTVATQSPEIKKSEPGKPAPTPAHPAPVKKEISAAVSTQPSEIKKIETTKTPVTPKPENIKKKTIEEDTKVNDVKKGPETELTPAKQQGGAALIEQQEDKQPDVSEEKMTAAADDQKREAAMETTPATQETTVALTQQENKQTETKEEKKITITTDDQKNEQQVTAPDSVQQEPSEATIKKAEETHKPVTPNHYYGRRTNGSWCEISNFKPNEFMMRYDVSAEDKTRFSFFEFAVDSLGKLKKEKMIEQVSDLKKQPFLKLQRIDSLVLAYGMQAMDKPFSYMLEYTVDSTQIGNARFQLYISGMPYNKRIADNKITEPFDFIVLDPWTGELLNKGNGNAVTDVDNELSIRMTTLIKNQDVQ